MLALGRAGVDLDGPVTDTMVLSYLLESGERNHNLDQLSQRLLDHTMIPITDLIGKGKNQGRMDQVAVDRVAEYAGEDADATWRIETILAAKVREQGLWTSLCRAGAALDRRAGADGGGRDCRSTSSGSSSCRASSRTGSRRSRPRHSRLAGRTFNINSGPQLRQVLFDELKLPSLQKTPGGEQSTAQEVLEELALKHPFPALLLQHRQLSKLKSTYLDALPGLVHPEDGRIHASFNQSVAATGRLSSSDPNLQNIPVRTEDGRQIRQAFVAGRPGWLLLTADYSQIELRILAHYSDDPALCAGPLPHDLDIHKAVAARIFGVARDGSRRFDAPGRQDREFRRRLRAVGLRAGRAGWASPRPRRPLHRGLFSGIRRRRSVHHPDARIRASQGVTSRRSWAGAGRSAESSRRPAACATSPSARRSTP